MAMSDNLAWAVFCKSIPGESLPISKFFSEPMSDLTAIRLQAMTAYLSGDCETASVLFDRAAEMSPSDVMSYFFAGNAHHECGRDNQAVAHWQKAGAGPYLLQQCEKAWQQERFEDVLVQCEYAVEVDPSLALAFDYLGRANTRLRQYRRAVEFYEQAIALDDTVLYVHIHAAIAYKQLGELETAERYLLLGIERNPTYDGGYYLLGTLYLEQARYGEAEKYLLEAIRLNDRRAGSFLSLGDLYCATRSVKKAENSYHRAYDLAPNNTEIQEKLQNVNTTCRSD